MLITSVFVMVQEVAKYPQITAEQLSESVSCELRTLATPDHLLKLPSAEIIMRLLASFDLKSPAVKKLMDILDTYEQYGRGGLSYYDHATLLHLRERALRRLIDWRLLPNLDSYIANSKKAGGGHGKPKGKTAAQLSAKLPTTDEFGELAKAAYWGDRVSELIPIQASLSDKYSETGIYNSVFEGSTDSLALLIAEIIHGSGQYPKVNKQQDRWAKLGGKCVPPNTAHVSMPHDKMWSTHAEAYVEATYTKVIAVEVGGEKELFSSMLRRLVMHVGFTFPTGDLSPEPQSVSHVHDASASSINNALERVRRVDAALYNQLTSVFPEGWEAQMVLGVQQDGGEDESSSHAVSDAHAHDDKGKDEEVPKPEASEGGNVIREGTVCYWLAV
jgi:hypothetical protein